MLTDPRQALSSAIPIFICTPDHVGTVPKEELLGTADVTLLQPWMCCLEHEVIEGAWTLLAGGCILRSQALYSF